MDQIRLRLPRERHIDYCTGHPEHIVGLVNPAEDVVRGSTLAIDSPPGTIPGPTLFPDRKMIRFPAICL